MVCLFIIMNTGSSSTMQHIWLIDETKPLNDAARRQMERELPKDHKGTMRGAQTAPNLAIRIQDMIIHDTKKWFGDADIRLDALVIHGIGTKENPETFYMPQTFRFPRVRDGDR